MKNNQNSTKSKKLVKGMAIYAIGTICTKCLSFLIVPLYTYYISTSDMGVYDLLYSTMSVLTPLITLQISDAAYRWMIRKEKIDESITTTFQFLIANSLIFSLIILVVNHFFSIPYCGYFIAMLITSRALATIQKLLRGLENQKLYAVSSIIYSVVYLSLNLLQIVVLKMGVISLFQSTVVANIFTVIAIFVLEKRLIKNFFKLINFRFLKELLAVSIPLVPNQLNWWVMSSSDRYVISIFINNSANGIYSIASKFPSVLQMMLSLFTTSWQDLSIADEKKDRKYYSYVFEKLYRVSFTMLPALIAVTQLYIRLMMDNSYHAAANYVAFLYLGTIFQTFSSFYGVGYIREKRTINASLTSIYGAIINFVVNIALIKFIGLYAAVLLTFLGFLVMWMIREYQNRESLQIKINKKKFCLYFFIAVAVGVASAFFTNVVDIVIFVIGGVYFSLINKSEIISIVKIIKRKISHSQNKRQ